MLTKFLLSGLLCCSFGIEFKDRIESNWSNHIYSGWPIVRETVENSENEFSGQWNPWKFRKLIQWSVKRWKSQEILSTYLGSQGIIAGSHTLESITHHILFMLYFGESKRQPKMVPTIFFHTIHCCLKDSELLGVSSNSPQIPVLAVLLTVFNYVIHIDGLI